MRSVVLALVHHPVLDRSGGIISTAVTNIDLHDMARSACAYGISQFFVVHPIHAQRDLIARVRDHWVSGSGARRIPDRVPPMKLLTIARSLDEVYESLAEGRSGVEVWTTSARAGDNALSFDTGRRVLSGDGRPVVLLFGTGWGLAPEVMEDADVRLEPIRALRNTGFNHLSVRAACAISLDRLFGAG